MTPALASPCPPHWPSTLEPCPGPPWPSIGPPSTSTLSPLQPPLALPRSAFPTPPHLCTRRHTTTPRPIPHLHTCARAGTPQPPARPLQRSGPSCKPARGCHHVAVQQGRANAGRGGEAGTFDEAGGAGVWAAGAGRAAESLSQALKLSTPQTLTDPPRPLMTTVLSPRGHQAYPATPRSPPSPPMRSRLPCAYIPCSQPGLWSACPLWLAYALDPDPSLDCYPLQLA